MRSLAVALCLLGGCRIGFDPADPVDPFTPSHVDAAVGRGQGVLVLGDAVIDTTTLLIDGAPPPAGGILSTAPQPGGPELAIWHVGGLTIEPGATVRVIGSRPLVIVADYDIELAGVLDASARAAVPGPGGSAPSSGLGAGGDVVPPPDNCDPAGGGGGFAQAGAPGGGICPDPGLGGPAHGDASIAILVGGSGGGTGAPGLCVPAPGGAGGGAVQLTAFRAIVVTTSGAIVVGGGGGAGGPECGMLDGGGGSGGGAGGAIFLEARALQIEGLLRADGGGGGAAGNGQTQNGEVSVGAPGSDASLGGPGVGGISTARLNETAGDGGRGGSPGLAPSPGMDGLNGGGGGGGAGWITQRIVE